MRTLPIKRISYYPPRLMGTRTGWFLSSSATSSHPLRQRHGTRTVNWFNLMFGANNNNKARIYNNISGRRFIECMCLPYSPAHHTLSFDTRHHRPPAQQSTAPTSTSEKNQNGIDTLVVASQRRCRHYTASVECGFCSQPPVQDRETARTLIRESVWQCRTDCCGYPRWWWPCLP